MLQVLMQICMVYLWFYIDLVLNDNIVDLVMEGVDILMCFGQFGDGGFVVYLIGEVGCVFVVVLLYFDWFGLIEMKSDFVSYLFICVKGIFVNE